ncbi:MAG: TonB-dependent receptor [Bacteroidota bacterium]
MIIKEVQIIEKRFSTETGQRITIIDSMAIKQSEHLDVSGLLSAYSPVFIKSYGPGSVASGSIRGSGASQVQVLWNGININSKMLGQTDLNEIPCFITDKIKIYHGQGNLMENSGSIGGSIHLNNQANWNNSFSLKSGFGFGSYETYKAYVNISGGNRKLQSSTRLYLTDSKNDFSYHDYTLSENPLKRNIYASFGSKGINQELYYIINQHNSISFKAWGQKSERNIPPVLGSSQTSQNEANEFLFNDHFNLIADYNYFLKDQIINMKSAYIHSYLNYTNNLLNTDANNFQNSFINKITYKNFLFKRLLINTYISNDYSEVISDNYDLTEVQSQNTIAMNAQFNLLKNNNLKLTAGNRAEIFSNSFYPAIPSFGAEYSPSFIPCFTISSAFSRNIHFPSFNDLYWSHGGNPDLKPENSNSAEITFQYNYKKSGHEAEVTAYHTEIKDMIIWLPTSAGFWSPSNLKEVFSRGIEADIRLQLVDCKKVKLFYNSVYTYTRSTNESSLNDYDESYKKQIIYVPLNQLKNKLTFSYEDINFEISNQYFGKRYITSDNNTYLPYYTLTGISIFKVFHYNRSDISFSVNIYNLFNDEYVAVSGYPMPGRNFILNIKYEFNK